jgi:hypothetical protein
LAAAECSATLEPRWGSAAPQIPILHGSGASPSQDAESIKLWLDSYQKQQAERQRKYGMALACVERAELVALGSSTVRDALEARYLGGREPEGQTREMRDRILAETERIVRSEIAAMR